MLHKSFALFAVRSMSKFFNILKLALEYKLLALLTIVFNILMVIFNLAAMLLFIPFLKLIFEETPPPTQEPQFALSSEYFEAYSNFFLSTYISEHGKLEALFFNCLVIATLFFLKNLFRYLAMFFLAAMRMGVLRDLRNQLYSKLIALPLSYYSDEKKGDIISRLSGDVQEIEVSIMSSLELVFREPLAIVASLGLMIVISPQLTLTALLLLPIGGLVIGRLGKSLKRTSAKGQSKLGDLMSIIEETLSGLRIIKAFNAEKQTINRFKEHNNHYKTLITRAIRKRDLASPLSEFLGMIVMVMLVWFGGKLILDGDSTSMDGSQFIVYIAIFSQLLRPAQAFSAGYANIQKGIASIDRIDAIMNAEIKITEHESPVVMTEFKDSIQYKDVHFRYEESYVLKGVNISVPKGKSVALVGESGGGKSTLADLLPRFHDCTKGSITMDGVDIRSIRISDLRSKLGVVTQQSILFNDTVRNNIAFGKPDATHDEIIEAAKVANANEFIEALESGYDTNIGDGGNKLSGGQRQRLSIARAILANPPILILDEATSALDTESEKLVQEALFRLMENRT